MNIRVYRRGDVDPIRKNAAGSCWRLTVKCVVASLVAISAAALSACDGVHLGKAEGAASAFQKRLNAAASEPENWLTYGGAYEEQRFSRLDQINDQNVGDLKLAWYFDFDTTRGQEATPLVVDGVMYTSSAWSKVFALDAATGKELWRYDPEVPGKFGFRACCDVVNRGVAYYGGKVFVGTIDGRLLALNAKTGALVWSTLTVDQSKPYTITGAPRVFNNKVIIGNGGAEYGVRGFVTAYDVDSGKQAWRFYTVPGDPTSKPDGVASDKVLAAKAKQTWFGKYWENGGGGTVWDSIVYDPEFNQVYIGVGNGSPWSHRARSDGKGDNLFLCSIVALDADTGEYKWHYQQTPAESWDFTATQQMTMADLNIGGRTRKVLMQAPKNGYFYILDRKSGELISANRYADEMTWSTHVDMATGRPVLADGADYKDKPFLNLPGGSGAHNWHPMSYSPVTGLVYIPVQRVPMLYADNTSYKRRPGRWNLGIDVAATPIPRSAAEKQEVKEALRGWLLAWDPVRGKEAWRVSYSGNPNGGVLATKGNLVFQGTVGDKFQAYRADTGAKLWSFDSQTRILAGPISYAVQGKQYIAVLAGYGGSAGLGLPDVDGARAQPNGRVLVFSLDGQEKLPVHNAALPPIQTPAKFWTDEQVKRGDNLFAVNCAMCHGTGTYSAGVLPDLKRSSTLLSKDAWEQVLLKGVLEDNGMVSFSEILDEQAAEDLRAFVASRAIEESRNRQSRK